MNFRSGERHEPEINLIPFIDVLLVVLIFLMLTTTYSKFTELQVNLPVADAQAPVKNAKEVIVAIGSDGRYSINKTLLESADVEVIARAIGEAADNNREAMVIISADAAATHQAVINVMDASRRAGLVQITFATQQQGGRQGATGKP